MLKETGDKNFKIWLLGDSEPDKWKNQLTYPFDDRHPIVHNIWTSIIDKVQHLLFEYNSTRIDSIKIYIRNAVTDSTFKPSRYETDWILNKELIESMSEYKTLIKKYKPEIIITFGSFAFEFGRRCLNEIDCKSINFWNTLKLGDEFKKRLFNDQSPKLLPLLHRSISGGHFLISHEHFCSTKNANYFQYVAENLFNLIKDNELYMIKKY